MGRGSSARPGPGQAAPASSQAKPLSAPLAPASTHCLKAAVTRSPSAATSAAVMATRISIASAGSLFGRERAARTDTSRQEGWRPEAWGRRPAARGDRRPLACSSPASSSSSRASQPAEALASKHSPQVLEQVCDVAGALEAAADHLDDDLQGTVGAIVQEVVLLSSRISEQVGS